MQSLDDPTRDKQPSRLRVAGSFASFALSAAYLFQFAPAFDRNAYLGAVFIMIACFHLMYGIMLLIQPWQIDGIGRARSDATVHSYRWYRTGVGINLGLIVLLTLSLTGIISTLSAEILELLSIVLGVILISRLTTLLRMVGP